MSAIPRHIVLCVFVLGSLGLVQGRGLLANLMKQADALKHGLDLASKVGDIGSHRNEVAFTVVPSSSTTYSSGSTIAFNTVKTNHGNAFNRGNYRFTAPSTGLYVFSWSIATHSSYIGNSRLMVNGSIFHQLNCQKTYQQCGSTVTVWLSKNSQVWVASAYSSIYVYSTYSSFSGWKIH
uniref:Caprin-2-like n=1 Tax=Crassostrea virginica TaxID=6565 RepID=A0A8B8AV54_CRAVI|nr:caprin-2-like [Crassostrea virginica]XP_022294130.1 caprin-2-like [Crassostrea virginica]